MLIALRPASKPQLTIYPMSANSAAGTFRTSRDVRSSVAFGGKADVAQAAHFGSD
jgi:hypothetical protein